VGGLTLHTSGAIKETTTSVVGGAVAQLGARLDGIEEVVGSNPIGSTNFRFSFHAVFLHAPRASDEIECGSPRP
jgi:hypothetical protein